MQKERIEAYIYQRLAELDGQKDLQELINKGRLSFGVDSTIYGHLPAWNALVKRKKEMVRYVWMTAFFVSLLIVCIVGNYFEKFEHNWIRALAGLLLISATIMLFYVISSFYSVFYHFRKTEREVRKLIYQDILSQLKKEEKETV